MVKALFVDVKDQVVQQINQMVQEGERKIEVIGIARDGGQALDMCARYAPQLLFINLEIFGRSGPQGIDWLTQLPSNLRLMFYQANEAQGVHTMLESRSGFCIVEAASEKMACMIERVFKSIEWECRVVCDAALLKQYLEECRGQMRQQFFLNLLRGHYSQDTLNSRLNWYGVRPLRRGVVCLQVYLATEHDAQEEQQYGTAQAAHGLIQELLDTQELGVCLYGKADEIIVLLDGKTQNPKAMAQQILERVSQTLHLPVLVGIGAKVKNWRDLPRSYILAKEALECRPCAQEGSLIVGEEIVRKLSKRRKLPFMDVMFEYIDAQKKELSGSQQEINHSQLEKLLKEAYLKLREHSAPIFIARMFSQEWTYQMTRRRYSLGDSLCLLAWIQTQDALEEAQNMGRLEKITLQMAQRVELPDQEDKLSAELVARIQEIVRTRYSEKLTMEGIAQELGRTPNYLSMLFSTHVGIKFKEYLIQVRIDEAKKLLRSTNLKVNEVAGRVGFKDHYFSTEFKRRCGITPLEYRAGREAG